MKLNHLTDNVLHTDVKQLVKQEREIISKILWHLKEIDKRKLYSDFKCSSLFDYCVKILHYSEGQAARRVSASRLLNELPQIVSEIEDGTLNLTQLNQARNFFTNEKINNPSDKIKVLTQIKGKSTRETEKILWSISNGDSPKKTWMHLNDMTVKKMNDVKSIKAHVHKDMDSFLMVAMVEIESLWTPKIKNSLRVESETRYLPPALKALVWSRDKAKCKICSSTHALEFDHIIPFSHGGKTSPDNLRLLCRNCNQRRNIVKTSGPPAQLRQ